MAEEPLPPGVLPNITDTDPPPINEGTIIGDGFVGAVPSCAATPYATYDGKVLSCTMGIWLGEPTSYAYQWKLDGNDVGTGDATYAPAAGETGEATCIVTASNDYGATVAPPSNAVAIGGSTRRPERAPNKPDEDPEAHPDHPQHHRWLERMRRRNQERQERH